MRESKTFLFWCYNTKLGLLFTATAPVVLFIVAIFFLPAGEPYDTIFILLFILISIMFQSALQRFAKNFMM